MIISIRGPSGSGKSHLVRRITALYDACLPVHVPGRQKPYFYIWHRDPPTGKPLGVIGHYEIANGGIDTLANLEEAYDTARKVSNDDAVDVIMEGKCMSDGTPSFMSLIKEKRDARILHLDTSVEECVASVRSRGHTIAEKTIQRTRAKVQANIMTFRNLKVPHVHSGDREYCFKTARHWLCL